MKRWISMALAVMLLFTLLPWAGAEDLSDLAALLEALTEYYDETLSHTHTYGDWVIAAEATCTQEGLGYAECLVCGAKRTQIIPRKAHTVENWTTSKAPTCTEEGERHGMCTVCHQNVRQAIAMLPHKFSQWSIITPETDHSMGIKMRSCTVCGMQESLSYDPEGTLRSGSSGTDVRNLQQRLVDMGLLEHRFMDGTYGLFTEKAVTEFQKKAGLTADGVAWPQTIRLLDHTFGPWTVTDEGDYYTPGTRTRKCTECGYTESEPIGRKYQKGDVGSDILTLQEKLNELGYNNGTPDGSYGDNTRRAVRSYQTDIGFEPDGIAWPGVWNSLFPANSEAEEPLGN